MGGLSSKAYPAFAARLLEQHRNIERVLVLIRLQVDMLNRVNSDRDLRLIERAIVYMDEFPALVHAPSEDILFAHLTALLPSSGSLRDRLSKQQSMLSDLSASLLALLRRAQAGDDGAYKLVKQSGTAYCLQYADHIHSEETEIIFSARRKLTSEDWESVETEVHDTVDPNVCPELKTHDSLYDFLMSGQHRYDYDEPHGPPQPRV